jgi:hypothetical protein
VVKQKTLHQSSFKSAAIKTTIFATSVFIIAHGVFGKPKISARAQIGGQTADSAYPAPISIYARLSLQSQLLVNNLQSMVNRSGLLPGGASIEAPFVLQTIAENAWGFSLSPERTISSMEKRVEALGKICERTRDGWLNAKLVQLQKELAVLKTFLVQATPDEQRQLLAELSKTFVVPVAP